MELKDHIEGFMKSPYNTMFILDDSGKLLKSYLMKLGFTMKYSGNCYVKNNHRIIVEKEIRDEGHFFTGIQIHSVVLSENLISSQEINTILYLRSRVRGSIGEPKVFVLSNFWGECDYDPEDFRVSPF